MRATVNGIELHYRDEGRGRPVVLIHGLGNTLSSWEGVARSLRTTYRVVRFDLRGSGGSSVPLGPYTPESWIADLRDLLDELDIDKAHLVGHSLGSLIATRFASEHTGRVRSLGLIGTGPGTPEAEKPDQRDIAASIERNGMAERAATEVETSFSAHTRETRPELLGLYRELLLANDPEGYAATMRGMLAFDLREVLDDVQAPAVLVVGEHDAVTPPLASFIVADGLTESSVVVLPDVGHMVPLAAPKRLAEELHDFLANL